MGNRITGADLVALLSGLSESFECDEPRWPRSGACVPAVMPTTPRARCLSQGSFPFKFLFGAAELHEFRSVPSSRRLFPSAPWAARKEEDKDRKSTRLNSSHLGIS